MSVDSKYYSMFKAFDVRGMEPDIDEKLFYWSGYALVQEVLRVRNLPLRVNIMYDARLRSQEFANWVAKGILDAGGEVVFYGPGGTDMLYAACVLNHNPGVELTASHNPKGYYGMKIVTEAPKMLGLSMGLDVVRDFVIARQDRELPRLGEWLPVDQTQRSRLVEFFVAKMQEVGTISDIRPRLVERTSRLKIVVDAGNGIAGVILPELVQLYPEIDFIPMYWEVDGNFPNHLPNPQEYENLQDLKRKILETGADFGVAFDGDADRMGVVDERGVPVEGDFLCALFAKALLKDYFAGKLDQKIFTGSVVYLQPGSRCVPEAVAEAGGVAIPSKQGHLFIKEQMLKHGSVYGGEFSGHHYFGVLKGMDSGILPMTLFIKVFVDSGLSKVSQLTESLEKFYHISELMSPRIPEGQTWADWQKKLEVAFADGHLSYVDGLSVFYPDWKFSMRPSGTEPVVRFILETRGENRVAEKVALVKQVIGLT